MVNKTIEEISMLMDDELDEHSRVRVIRKLKADNELKSCWEHYHLISEALRKNLPDYINPDFANRISNILLEEPAHQILQTTPAASVSRNRMLTGFSIAASLAVVAVAVLLQLNRHNESPDQQLVATQEASNAAVINSATVLEGQATVASLSMPNRSIDVRMEQLNPVNPDQQLAQARMYDYLIHHNEYAVTAPVQGAMLPYARMVGYASGE